MSLLPGLTIESIVMYLLVAFRVAGIFMFSPLLSNRSVPDRVKIFFVMALAFLMMPIIEQPAIDVTNHIQLLIYIFQEATIGFTIGVAASFVFACINIAGEIMGMQMGFAMATIFDPANQTNSGVLTSFYIILGALFFLYLDGHHLILLALGRSFDVLPLTQGFSAAVGYEMADLVARIFVFSIQIASPLVVVILILNLMFGLITKLSPQMNIYFNTGFIIGPIVGLLVLLLSLPLFRFLMLGMTERMDGDLMRVLSTMKGSL